MADTARHHHHIPDFYLRGFGQRSKKKILLTVTQLRTGTVFKTTTRNVGGTRDFSRQNCLLHGSVPLS